MFETLALVFGVLLAVSLIPVLFIAIRNAFRERGPRVITCPENGCHAVVEVDAWKSGLSSAFGEENRRLAACSRWPEMEGCDQACLSEITGDPNGCLVRGIVADWYAGHRCAGCGREIHARHAADRRPGLRAPDGRAVELADVSPLDIDRVLATHEPVCANCFDGMAFRQKFPGVAVERPQSPTTLV
ncbi:MAG TPA: hypothetical protein VFA98_11485 [Thermoanaerobaculia bacterium]|nr:hypothetical protein [Thermoanaerobaculia bacterium]